MSKQEDAVRRDLRDALRTMRREIEKVRKDVASATRTWIESTEKLVRDKSPKVGATLDEAMDRTSTAFRQAMSTIDRQTRSQQLSLLRGYRSFLSKQIELIEKRLKELTK